MRCEAATAALLRRTCRPTLETMELAGITLEQFDAQVRQLKAQALRRQCEVFPELWLVVNVCSGRSARYILGPAGARPFRYVKHFIGRWDEIKTAGQAVASERRRRFYTRADPIAQALEREERDEPSGHFRAVKPWVAISGTTFPASGSPSLRLAWYRRESYFAQLAQDNHLRGMRFNLLVTGGDMSVPYAVCTLRCPHCGRIVTDAAHLSALASHEEYSRLKLAALRGALR